AFARPTLLGNHLVQIEQRPRQRSPGGALVGVALAGAGDGGGVQLLLLEAALLRLDERRELRPFVGRRRAGEAAAEEVLGLLLGRALAGGDGATQRLGSLGDHRVVEQRQR